MTEEEIRRRKRKRRMMERRRKKQRQRRMLLIAAIVVGILLFIGIIFGIRKAVGALSGGKNTDAASVTSEESAEVSESAESLTASADEDENANADPSAESTEESADESDGASEDDTSSQSVATSSPIEGMTAGYTFSDNGSTQTIGDEVWSEGSKDSVMTSDHALLIDLADNSIVCKKAEREQISPASMTKIMTMLVAAEHVTDLNDTFTMTIDITDYSYSNDCSAVGFLVGEQVPVKDLMYGTMLQSGGDAALGLATYVSGSQDAFVELMNQKAQELGISQTTHFTNVMGIYDENHYSTAYDIAVIMKAAMENELCREVMSTHVYTTTATTEHPDGITISNWFLRRIEDKVTEGEVMCAKTGFVVESRNCCASYYISPTGKQYIAVTAGASSSWRCIFDHSSLYKRFTQ